MSLVWQVRSCTPPPSTLPKLVGACFVPVRNCWKVTRNLLKFWRFPACSRHEHEVSLCHQPRRQGVVAFVFLVLMKLPIENLAIHTVSAKMDAVCGSARAHSGARRKKSQSPAPHGSPVLELPLGNGCAGKHLQRLDPFLKCTLGRFDCHSAPHLQRVLLCWQIECTIERMQTWLSFRAIPGACYLCTVPKIRSKLPVCPSAAQRSILLQVRALASNAKEPRRSVFDFCGRVL